MCGILGTFRRDQDTDPTPRLSDAISALEHRGPDDRGQEIMQLTDGCLAFGHTRLSIIDLSSGGHQPMSSSDGRYTLVFNGEIYNYRELREELRSKGHVFQTDSDTEALLFSWIQWGKACLPKLKGMFAFAIFDRQDETLICVRDAFGIKPFYYQSDSECFAFASEIPALLRLLDEKPGLNLQRAYDYLVFGRYDDQESTFHEGVKHLMPGHHLTICFSQENVVPEIGRWWWPEIEERPKVSFEDATKELREIFLQSVRLHLRSDVPLGAALSGGIDSSAIVCAIRHLDPDVPIHTFSFVAPGSTNDEERWADQVNHHVGAIPHKVIVSPDELIDDLDDMIRAQGEPFGSTSIYAQYRVFRLAREHGIKVTLDGQGADELLAGYHGYPKARMHSMLDRWECGALCKFLIDWPRWPGRSRKEIVRLLAELVLPYPAYKKILHLRGWHPEPKWLKADFLRHSSVNLTHPPELDYITSARGRRLMDVLRRTLSGCGLTSLLRHGDRNSMRWSIESRVPFLTNQMAEFTLGLPEEFLLSAKGETKRIFRAAMQGIVPDPILHRKDKIGFATPERHWLKHLHENANLWLEGLNDLPFVDQDACRTLLGDVLEEKIPFSYQVWRFVNFGRWIQLNNN